MDVQRLSVVNLSGKLGVRREARKQMCTVDDGIQMNDAHISATMDVLGLNNPQTCWFVGLVTKLCIPVHKSTRVVRVGK